MRPVSTGKRPLHVFLGITLAILGPLYGLTLKAQTANPVPLINQPLVPDATAPGGPQFTLTINGTGFVSNSTVNWNTTPLATTFISGSELTAIVPAADVATAGTGWVTVVNPVPGGGTSNVAFLSVRPSGGNSAQFSQGPSLAVGASPTAVAVGDFNGDGKLDLAVANQGSGTVSILLGDGVGNFMPASSPVVGEEPVALATGDFNSDGKLDLAVANAGNDVVSILLGDGKGNFTLASSPYGGSGPNALVAGDFNGDGKLDLAVADVAGAGLSILLGDGTGQFTPAPSPPAGVYTSPVAMADFNRDGHLDLAVTNVYGSTVTILIGDGTGNFNLASTVTVGTDPESVVTGDFNGDGNPDLAVVNDGSNTVSILLGDGSGNFSLASSPATGVNPVAVAGGDFNGDGILDLAVTNYPAETVSILLGDGTGNFTLASSTPTGAYPVGVAVGDFNGDGTPDLAVADWYTNSVAVLLGVPPSPSVTLAPASLSFGTQLLGTTSSPQSVTLTNTGAAGLDITSIVASANFSQTNNCGSSLDVGANCTITVTFAPRGLGTFPGSITVTDNASNSPQSVSLTGVATEVGLAPATLSFGSETVGTTSSARTITLLNRANRNLTIFGFGIRGSDAADFAQTNTCGSGLGPEASCTITVTFTPQARGSRTATLNVSDNGGASPQKVTLSGKGM